MPSEASASAGTGPRRCECRRGGDVSTTESDLYYDPYDFEIDANPYPIWRRLRDERAAVPQREYDFTR